MAFVVLLPPHHHLQLDSAQVLVHEPSTWIPWFDWYLIFADRMHDELHEEEPRTMT